MSCKKQRRLTLREHTEFTSELLGRVCVPHLFSFLCCPITCPSVVSSVLWCPIRFPHQQQNLCLYLTLFVVGLMSYLPYLCLFVVGLMSYLPYLCLSLSHAVCSRAHVLFTLFVFACVKWYPTHIVLCFCFVFLRLVYPMLSVSLNCQCLIAPSVFSFIYKQKLDKV